MNALEGIRIVDLTTAYSAPIGTMQLGDFGADVIKVENTGLGDGSRTWNPFMPYGESMAYMYINRNKRSIALNLKSEEGKKALFELVKTADVVVENFRPGVAAKLGIDYEAMKAVKPDIIMASLSGYGQTGPDAKKGAYSNLAEAQSGLMSLTGFPDEEGGQPTASGVAFGDSIAGMFLVQGILYALIHHMRTGEGQYIDVAMVDSLIALIQHGITQYSITGENPPRLGNRDLSEYPYDTFKAKDGWCFLGNATTADWTRFTEAIGRPDLAQREELKSPDGRWQHLKEIHDIVADWAAQRTRAEIEERFMEYGQLYSPINTISEMMENPQTKAREMIVDLEYRGVKYKDKGIPVKMSKTPGSIRMMPPTQGQHTDEVLKSVGYTDEQLAQLRADGAIL